MWWSPPVTDSAARPAQWLALFGLMAAFAAPWLQPTPARGAACCISASSVGVGRLKLWEDMALGVRASYAYGLGSWNQEAAWVAHGDDYTEDVLRSEFWAIVRLDRRASAQVLLPVVWTRRGLGAGVSMDGGVGDLKLGGRYEAIRIGERQGVPGVALAFGASLPTGRAPERAQTTLATDVTSRGAAALSVGVSVEHTWAPLYLRGDLGLSIPLPFRRQDLDVAQWLGLGVDGTVAVGVQISPAVVLSLLGHARWRSPIVLDGVPLDRSEQLSLSAGVTSSFRFDNHWSVQLSVDSGFFVDGVGQNVPGAVTGTLGLRYGHF